MSKRKKSKKKNTKKYVKKNKQFNKKKVLITSIICGTIVLLGAVAAIIFGCINAVNNAKIKKLCEWDWFPVTATDASGDQANLQEIYSVNYESFQGSLSFFDDGEFTFWMTPGDSSDGTHSGIYEYTQDDTVDVMFDDGTYTTFSVEYDGTSMGYLYVNYDDYKIKFSQHPYESRIKDLSKSEWTANFALDSDENPVELNSLDNFEYKSVLFNDDADSTCVLTLNSGQTAEGTYTYNQYNEITVTLSDSVKLSFVADFDGENINNIVFVTDDYNVTFKQ